MTSNAAITEKWDQYLEKFPLEKRDIYFTEQYAKLYGSGKDKASCFVYEDSGDIFLFPFISREIDDINRDLETPYGYGGPICSTDD